MAKGKEMKAVVSIGGAIDPSLNKSISKAITSTKGMSTAMSGAFRSAGNDLAKLDAAFGGIEKAAKAALSVAAVGAGAVTAGLAASIKVGSAFEAQMSTVEAISGASASEMERLSSAAMELGSSTQFTASEVGQAMEYMGMAGWKAEDMLAGIDGVLNLAAASGEDLATVSDILTDDLTAFGMSASEAGRMVDVMAATATNANTNVSMMGETFKYAAPLANTLGFSLEDVAVATGLMANSGIKASQAGTTMRSWMSRMAAPTKQTAEAMNELGLSLTDDEGNMKSFSEIIQDTRESMQGLSADEQARYASMIAGKNAMSGMLAVINATEEDTRKLTDAINDSAGAAQRMADIRMDNLQGDVTKFKSALEGLGIAIYQEAEGPARDAVQGLTGFVGQLKEKLPGTVADILKKLPEVGRRVKKFLTPVFDFVKGGIKWLIDNKKAVIGVVAGVGTALVTYKIAKKIMEIGTALTTLVSGPMGIAGTAILGITTAIGGLVTALTIYQQHLDDLRDQSLAEHFGNISLTMDEAQTVVDYLTGSQGIEKIKKSLAELDTLGQIGETIDTEISKLNKYNWMISIGLELDDEAKENFRSTIESYITDTNEYLNQDYYAVQLNLSAGLSEDVINSTGIMDTLKTLYTEKNEELSALGKQLNEAVTAGFEDGFLDFDEQQVINDLQIKMEHVRQGLAMSEAQSAMKLIELDAMELGGNLDPESFAAILERSSEQIGELNNITKESYITTQTIAENTLNAQSEYWSKHAATMDEYAAKMQEATASYNTEMADATEVYLNQKLENTLKSFDFGIGTLMTSAYGEELNAAVGPVQDLIQEFMDTAMNPDWLKENGMLVNSELVTSGSNSIKTMVENMQAEVAHIMDENGGDPLALKSMLEKMAPQEAEMEQLAQEYRDAGQEVPKAIAEGITTFNLMEAMTGNEGSLWQVVGSQLESDGTLDTLKQSMNDNGASLPKEVAQGIEANQSLVEPGIVNLFNSVSASAKAIFSQGIDVTVPVNISYSESGGSPKGYGGMPSGIASRSRFANGGFTSGPSLAGEEGTEAVISFKSSVRDRNINIWKKAGEILGATSGGSSSSTSETITTSNGANITFAPNITINGDADKDTVIAALRKSLSEFKDLLAEAGYMSQDDAGYAYG